MVLEAADDLILKILMFSGVLLIVLNLLVEEEKETAWIDGFAILCSCTVVIGVTALNDYKKEKEF